MITNILVAHNAKFDVDMLEKEGIHPKRIICTLKLARHMDPNGVIPRYSLQYLRYFLGIKIKATTHDALGDILVLEKLFERLFAKMSEDIGPGAVENKMMDISSKPVLLTRMYFGKHKGAFFKDIPQDYLRWLKDIPSKSMNHSAVHWCQGNIIRKIKMFIQ